MDIAALGFRVDSSDLPKGTRELERLGAAAARTGTQVEKGIGAANKAIQNVGRTSAFQSNDLRNLAFQMNQVGQQGAITGNYLSALAFQMPDLLLSFGTLGIVLGAVAAPLGLMAIEMLNVNYAGGLAISTFGVLAPVFEAIGGAAQTAASAFGSALSLLADNLDRIIVTAGVAVGFFGARWLTAFVAARVATLSLSTALVVLRGALIRTGVGALIVLAGELVFQFTRLVQGAGSFGQAMILLGDVALGVWKGIVTSAQAVPDGLQAIWLRMVHGFQTAIAKMVGAWSGFLVGLGDAAAKLEAIEVLGQRPFEGLGSGIRDAAAEAGKSAASIQVSANEAFTESEAAAGRFSTALSGAFDDARDAAGRLLDTVRGVERTGFEGIPGTPEGEGGSGGGGGGGRSALEKVKDDISELQALTNDVSRDLGGAFSAAVRGAETLHDALGRVLDRLADTLLSSAFEDLFNLGFGTLLNADGNAFARGRVTPFARGGVVTGPTLFPMANGAGLMGEAGPEAVMPLRRLPSGRLGVESANGGNGGTVVQVINNGGQEPRVDRGRGPDGRELIRVTVNEQAASGGLDQGFGGRFGARPQTVRR